MKGSNDNTPNKFISVDGKSFDNKTSCCTHNYCLLWEGLGNLSQKIDEVDDVHPLNYTGSFPDEKKFFWFDLKTEKDLASVNEFLTSAYEKLFSKPVNDNYLVKKLGIVCFECGNTYFDFFKFYYLEDGIEYLQDFLKGFGLVANIAALESSK